MTDSEILHKQNRTLQITLKFGETKYEILNIYAPYNGKKNLEFFKNLSDQIENYPNLILGGDFNNVVSLEDI